MKPIPTSSMQAATASGPSAIWTPSASSTSAEPQAELAARLPCLAILTPAPAATKAAVVEMLNVPRESPPVPTTSTSAS